MVFLQKYDSPLGTIVLAQTDEAISGLWFQNQKYFPETLSGAWQQTPLLERTARWLDRYFRGENPDVMELPLAPKGSEFRTQVWEILRTIPYGQVTTYAAIAAEIARQQGKPRMSAQAVGGAVGHNPISILIPCHRVVAVNGSLTGYAGGLERKEALLKLEGGCVLL